MSRNAPWRQSAHTQIWNVTERARASQPTANPADDAGLACWLVCAPWMAAGAWIWHYAAVIHLRDLPGQSKPPTLLFPDATHEFLSFAVHPDTQPDMESLDFSKLSFLSPVSICQQFSAVSDADALERIEHYLEHVVVGELTLESDGRTAWETLLRRPIPQARLA